MMYLCIGSLLKLLSLCKRRNSVTDYKIAEKLFPMYTGDINPSFVGHLKACDKNLSPEIVEYILNTDIKLVENELCKIAQELINSVIDTNKAPVFVASLLYIISEDDSILLDTVIGLNKQYKKINLLKATALSLKEFLINILFFVYSTGNNTNGKTFVKKINHEFISSTALLNYSITVVTDSDTDVPFSYGKKEINRTHPFMYNSNSCSFIGRESEMKSLKNFVQHDNVCLKWWELIGTGGSGKSRLAYEFSKVLNKSLWDTFFITRDVTLTFDNLQSNVCISDKNIFIIIDTEVVDMEPLAKWISYQYSQMRILDIRVLICHRTPPLIANVPSSWYKSLIDYNEIVCSLEYKDPSFEGPLLLTTLDDNSLKGISKSYISTLYVDVKLDDSATELILNKLKTIDSFYLRPLFLLFISEAFANGDINKIQNEDSLLNYAFLRERNYIRNIIEDAFETDYIHNSKLFDAIEISFALASVSSPLGISQSIWGHEEVNMSEEQFKIITDSFGLTNNGCIVSIKPDLLAEYFYMRYGDQAISVLAVQAFWVPFFRDFNLLLTTKYRCVLQHLFQIENTHLGLYYMEGLYEAFCTTTVHLERERLFKLLSQFTSDYEEWIGNDPLIHPLGPEFAITSFFMIQGRRYEKILCTMSAMLTGNIVEGPKEKYDIYDSFVGNYAYDLYAEIENMIIAEQNAIPLIDKINEFTNLYQSNEKRWDELSLPMNAELPIYYSHALFALLIFFFGRGLEYEDKLAIQVATMVPKQLNHLCIMHDSINIATNYIKALMTLYTEDTHDFYKSKPEIMYEIVTLYKQYGSREELSELFSAFFLFVDYEQQ